MKGPRPASLQLFVCEPGICSKIVTVRHLATETVRSAKIGEDPVTVPTPEPARRVSWVPAARDPSAPTQVELADGTTIGEIVGEPELQPGDSVDVYPLQLDGRLGYAIVRPDRDQPPQRRDETDEETGATVTTWVLDDGTEAPFGPVEWALRRDLAQLKSGGQLAGTLIASATALAQAMDRAQPDKIAGIGRELREHVKRIEEQAGDDDDTRDHRANLSTPV
jgi:hypothetical protein